jgi:hypothetical protein
VQIRLAQLRTCGWPASIAIAAGCVVGAFASPAQIPEASSDLVREPAKAYFTAPVSDPVAELNSRLQSGTVRLTFDDVRGYLPSVLDALQLSAASQVMVFSKTSVQASRISPVVRGEGPRTGVPLSPRRA